MQFKKMSIAVVASAAALMGSVAMAAPQFAKAEDAVKYRQSAFSLIGTHFSALGAMASGKAPYDAKAAAEHADVLAVVAGLPWAAFGEGTEGGKAKPEIWKEKAKFDEKHQAFGAEASKLLEAAKSGDLDKLKAAFGPTAQTCKSCHDAYKSK